MQLQFCEYEPWMKEQVIEMFCKEYGNERKQFTEYYDNFYSGYQENKSLRLVILDEKTVAGFVSFSFWPYFVNGQISNSYQCGNVIIHEGYRGKGLYNQLLNYLNENAANYKIDFIVGFPIKEILKLYLKSKWKNPFNLNWYVKILNPAGMLFNATEQKLSKVFASEKKYVEAIKDSNTVTLAIDRSFYAWNRAYNNLARHFYFEFTEGANSVEFSLKLNKRKYINELIVGEINTNSADRAFLSKAFTMLQKKASGIWGLSILSICLNDRKSGNPVLESVLTNGFKKIDKDIKFIVNNFTADEQVLLDPGNWNLYRRDIDTW